MSVGSGKSRLGALEPREDIGNGESIYIGNGEIGEIVRDRELSLDDVIGI